MNQELPTRLGKTTRRRTIYGEPMVYTIVDEDVFVAPSNKDKAFCLHKLRHHDGREEFRIAYYMIAQKSRMKGKWAYGQFAPMMTREEMSLIFQRAQAKGWI